MHTYNIAPRRNTSTAIHQIHHFISTVIPQMNNTGFDW